MQKRSVFKYPWAFNTLNQLKPLLCVLINNPKNSTYPNAYENSNHNQFWLQGYGKEAVKAAITLAFDKLNYHRIEAHINLDNLPSIKLAESVGLQFECRRKGFLYEFDEWTDHLIYYINSK